MLQLEKARNISKLKSFLLYLWNLSVNVETSETNNNFLHMHLSKYNI